MKHYKSPLPTFLITLLLISILASFNISFNIPAVQASNVSLSPPTDDGYIDNRTFTKWNVGAAFNFGNDSTTSATYRAYVEWDVSSIPDTATILSVSFEYEGTLHIDDGHIHDMLIARPTTAANQQIYNDAGNGTVYANVAGFPAVGVNKHINLSSVACSDLQSQLASNWFAIGLQADNEDTAFVGSSAIGSKEIGSTPDPTLYVVFNFEPTIGEFEADDPVYANQYFQLNTTVDDQEGVTDIDNVTISMISGVDKIDVFWDNATDAFSEVVDSGNWYVLNSSACFSTTMNATAKKLTFEGRLGWNYTEGLVNVNGTVFDSVNLNGTATHNNLFTFEEDLDISVAYADDTRLNPSDNILFNGTAYYEGTSTAPSSGNSSMSFDGTNDKVTVTHDSSLNATNITLEVWIKSDSFSNGGIVAKRSGSINYALSTAAGTGEIYFQIYDGAFNPIARADSQRWDDGAWHHVVGMRNTVTDSVLIYVDNVVRANITDTTTGTITNVGDILIGVDSASYYTDNVDELRLYNRTLPAIEISEHYNGIFKNDTGLVLYLPFHDDSAQDMSGEGNNGVNNGAVGDVGVYSNVEGRVELAGVLQATVYNLNLTDGVFYFPYITTPNEPGNYSYNVYTFANHTSTTNQTVYVVVSKLAVNLTGIPPTSVLAGATVTIEVNITDWGTGETITSYDIDVARNNTAHLSGVTANFDEHYTTPRIYNYTPTAVNSSLYPLYGITAWNVTSVANATWHTNGTLTYDVWLNDYSGFYVDGNLEVYDRLNDTLMGWFTFDTSYTRAYLVPNNLYYFKVVAGANEFLAETWLPTNLTFSHVITILQIPLSPLTEWDAVVWEAGRLGNHTIATIQFRELSDATIRVYNATNDLQVTQNYVGVTGIAFDWAGSVGNQTYWVLLNSTSANIPDFQEVRVAYRVAMPGQNQTIPLPFFTSGMIDPGIFSLFLLFGVAMIFSAYNRVIGLVISTSFLVMFNYFGWLNLNMNLIAIVVVATILYAFKFKGGEKETP